MTTRRKTRNAPSVHFKSGQSPKQRARAFLRLKNNHHKTLQEIGDEYGLTRERVRQILNLTGEEWERGTRGRPPLEDKVPYMFTQVWWEQNRVLSDDEISSMVGIRRSSVGVIRRLMLPYSWRSTRGHRDAKNSVLAVRDRLVKHAGFNLDDFSYRNGILRANGVRIMVRNASWTGSYWKAGTLVSGDFVVVVCDDEGDWLFFVIPTKDCPKSGVSITHPVGKGDGKYAPYLGRWDLVRAERLRKMRGQGGPSPHHQQVENPIL